MKQPIFIVCGSQRQFYNHCQVTGLSIADATPIYTLEEGYEKLRGTRNPTCIFLPSWSRAEEMELKQVIESRRT